MQILMILKAKCEILTIQTLFSLKSTQYVKLETTTQNRATKQTFFEN